MMNELYNIIFTLTKLFNSKPYQVILGIYMHYFITSQATKQFLILVLKLKSRMDQLTELLLSCALVQFWFSCYVNSLTVEN